MRLLFSKRSFGLAVLTAFGCLPAVAYQGINAVNLDGGESFSLSGETTAASWGDNSRGQLGNGSTEESHIGTRVTDPIAAVMNADMGGFPSVGGDILSWSSFSNCQAAGGAHGLTNGDEISWAWGANEHGQLGDGTTVDRPYPVPILSRQGLPMRFGGFAAGRAHSLGDSYSSYDSRRLVSTPILVAWGANEHGQLGDGTTVERHRPVPVLQADGRPVGPIVYLAAGDAHSIGGHADGQILAWGANDRGQLGDGTTVERHHAVYVVGADGLPIDHFGGMVAGGNHNLTLGLASRLYSWGANEHGQLGDGTTEDRPYVAPVVDEQGRPYEAVGPIAAGRAHSLMRWSRSYTDERPDGVYAWGDNSRGQLGDGTTVDRHHPVPVRFENGEPLQWGDIVALAAGDYHSFAVRPDGTVLAWGANDHGQLGDGTTVDRHYPVVVLDRDGQPLNLFAGDDELRGGANPYLMQIGESASVQRRGSAVLKRGEPLKVKTQLDVGPHVGTPVEIWLSQRTPRGTLLWYELSSGTWAKRQRTAYSGPLDEMHFYDTVLVDTNRPQVGIYAFLFIVDHRPNGRLDPDAAYVSRLWVEVPRNYYQ